MPGAGRTKQLLAESMKQLMKQMPLEKITVSDIVEQADIGRNTFYYHFQDKYDLVIWIFQTESAGIFAEGFAKKDWFAIVARLESYFHQNREFYCSALAYDGQNSLREYLFEQFKEMAIQQIQDWGQQADRQFTSDELDFAGDFISSALQGMLVRWAARGMDALPAEYRTQLYRLFQGGWLRSCLQGSDLPQPPADAPPTRPDR